MKNLNSSNGYDQTEVSRKLLQDCENVQIFDEGKKLLSQNGRDLVTESLVEEQNPPPLPPRGQTLQALPTNLIASNRGNLEGIIASLLDKRGRFQIVIIVLLCLNSVTVGINHTITSFHAYVPHFYCKDNRTLEGESSCSVIIQNQTCPSGYIFDDEDASTIVSEWSLVCDRRFLAPLFNTLYFVGVTFGAVICGSLADLWGRNRLTLACLYLQGIMAIALYFSDSLVTFIIIRVIQGFFIQGLQNCSYTLMLEYCPARYRTAAAVFWELNWAVGLAILGLAASVIQSWRVLTLVLLTPTAMSLLYCWIFPESVSWLCAKGRHAEAYKLVRQIAKKNNDKEILQEIDRINLEQLMPVSGGEDLAHAAEDATISAGIGGSNSQSQPIADLEKHPNVLAIVKCSVLRKHLIVMVSVWFSVTLSYYGILYFLPNLAGNRYINFLIGAGIEAIAYIMAYFILSKCGRRLPISLFQLISGLSCILMGFIKFYYPDTIAIIVLALFAKGLAVASFCGMFIYCSELFPTVCRGIALGLCGMAARVGSLLAPQLMIFAEAYPQIPMTVLGVLVLLSGSLTLVLPETLSTKLPNTIRDAVTLWSGVKRK